MTTRSPGTPSALARSITGAKRSSDASMPALVLRRLKASEAAVNTAMSAAPQARARS